MPHELNWVVSLSDSVHVSINWVLVWVSYVECAGHFSLSLLTFSSAGSPLSDFKVHKDPRS